MSWGTSKAEERRSKKAITDEGGWTRKGRGETERADREGRGKKRRQMSGMQGSGMRDHLHPEHPEGAYRTDTFPIVSVG